MPTYARLYYVFSCRTFSWLASFVTNTFTILAAPLSARLGFCSGFSRQLIVTWGRGAAAKSMSTTFSRLSGKLVLSWPGSKQCFLGGCNSWHASAVVVSACLAPDLSATWHVCSILVSWPPHLSCIRMYTGIHDSEHLQITVASTSFARFKFKCLWIGWGSGYPRALEQRNLYPSNPSSSQVPGRQVERVGSAALSRCSFHGKLHCAASTWQRFPHRQLVWSSGASPVPGTLQIAEAWTHLITFEITNCIPWLDKFYSQVLASHSWESKRIEVQTCTSTSSTLVRHLFVLPLPHIFCHFFSPIEGT